MNSCKNRRISVSEMAPHIHSFGIRENKVEKISKWLMDWIDLSLDCGKIQPFDLLPLKADLACHIGVSQGTIQNVYRILEDKNYVESKQRIGTLVKNRNTQNKIEKLTSKRDLTVEVIKKYIIDNNYQEGDNFISTRKLAKIIGISNTTLNFAMRNLVYDGVFDKKGQNYIVKNLKFKIQTIETKTLVEKIAEEIKLYIERNLTQGSKLPANSKLTKMFNVSAKTIHDAIRLLSKSGIICIRRGRYGTFVLGDEDKTTIDTYIYEKIEQKIREFIYENCQSGDKLPSIRNLAIKYEVSEKTVKKALDNLYEDGYIRYSRGRYGGTFVIDVPQATTEAYKWLAISNDYIPSN